MFLHLWVIVSAAKFKTFDATSSQPFSDITIVITSCMLQFVVVTKVTYAATLNISLGRACTLSICCVLQFGVVTQASAATLDSNFATVFQKVEQSVTSGGALQGDLFW